MESSAHGEATGLENREGVGNGRGSIPHLSAYTTSHSATILRGCFRSFLTRKRTVSGFGMSESGGWVFEPSTPEQPRQPQVWQGACKALVCGHGRFDTFDGDCSSAHGSESGEALIWELTNASRVGLVVWSPDSQSGGRGSIPLRGTGVRTLKEGRPPMTQSSVRELGNVPPAPANNRLWCNWKHARLWS